MEICIYSEDMALLGVIDEITSFIWTRKYWSSGEFKLLAPFTEHSGELLTKKHIIMKKGDTEAAQIKYVNIQKDGQGQENIEVQGQFLSSWIGKRVIENQIITKDHTQSILYRMIKENMINPSNTLRRIPNIDIDPDDKDVGSGTIEYTSGQFENVLLAVQDAARAAKLGFRVNTDVSSGKHYFSVYAGRDLTSDQTENPPCIFSKEFDNIIEQEFVNSIEHVKTTAYVGGEEAEGQQRVVAEVGADACGLEREEVFVNASGIKSTYKDEDGNEVVRTPEAYGSCLADKGVSELMQYKETLGFESKVNTHGNLAYREDFDLGDRVTCIDKRWGVKINVRITEISEIYQQNGVDLDITFGESMPTLLEQIRQMVK